MNDASGVGVKRLPTRRSGRHLEDETQKNKDAPASNRRLSRRDFIKGVATVGFGIALGSGARVALVHTNDPIDPHGGWSDAITHKTMDDLKQFTDFLTGAKGYVGEVGWPNNNRKVALGPEFATDVPATDQEQWDALAETWLKEADAKGLWVTYHSTSERQLRRRGYGSSQYASTDADDLLPLAQQDRAISLANFQAARVEAHLPAGLYRGANFAGGQNWIGMEESTRKGIPFNSNTNPGSFDIDYWYPGLDRAGDGPNTGAGMNSFEYLRSKGHSIVRLGLRWERIQPTLGGTLSPTEVGRYTASVNAAGAAGLKVIIDVHNYGGYYLSSGRQPINSAAVTINHFRNLWKRLSSRFKNNPHVIAYDLMNEPQGDGGIARGAYSSKAKAWEDITRKVISTIRGNKDRKMIMVPTYCGIGKLRATHPAKWVTNAGAEGRDFMYTVHHYWDASRYRNLPPTQPQADGTGGGSYRFSYEDDNEVLEYRGY